MFDQADFDRAACRPEERRALLPLAPKLREIAELASAEGLFALGRFEDGPDADLAAGIRELLSDERAVPLGDRLRSTALVSGTSGAALLRRMMIAVGLSALAAGMEGGVLEQMVLACLGADLFFETKKWQLIC